MSDKVYKTQYVADLKVKDQVKNPFIVKYINLMSSRDGKNYLNVILADKTGDLEARVWHGAREISERVGRGDFVFVLGKVNSYQGRKQLVIEKIDKTDSEDIDIDQFVAKSDKDPEGMYAELQGIVAGLDDYFLRTLLEKILQDQRVQRDFKVCPAGKTIHHPYRSGLLEHTLACTKLADFLAGFYGLNKNFVVAGTILHDLCKINEFNDELVVEYSDEGKLVGHLINSVELVNEFSKQIENFPGDTLMHLKHILISHHGHLEYGSPKLPQTSEAMLVHLIDLMDSKVNAFEVVKTTDTQPGAWTSFVRHLDRIVYKHELPTYKTPDAKPIKAKEKKKSNSHSNKDPKQNLGKLLEGYKVD